MQEQSKDRRAPGPIDPNAFVAGLFTGALVGAALAMVLAPASGEEMRDLLRAKAREAGNRARDAAGDLSDFATDMYNRKQTTPDDVM